MSRLRTPHNPGRREFSLKVVHTHLRTIQSIGFCRRFSRFSLLPPLSLSPASCYCRSFFVWSRSCGGEQEVLPATHIQVRIMTPQPSKRECAACQTPTFWTACAIVPSTSDTRPHHQTLLPQLISALAKVAARKLHSDNSSSSSQQQRQSPSLSGRST